MADSNIAVTDLISAGKVKLNEMISADITGDGDAKKQEREKAFNAAYTVLEKALNANVKGAKAELGDFQPADAIALAEAIRNAQKVPGYKEGDPLLLTLADGSKGTAENYINVLVLTRMEPKLLAAIGGHDALFQAAGAASEGSDIANALADFNNKKKTDAKLVADTTVQNQMIERMAEIMNKLKAEKEAFEALKIDATKLPAMKTAAEGLLPGIAAAVKARKAWFDEKKRIEEVDKNGPARDDATKTADSTALNNLKAAADTAENNAKTQYTNASNAYTVAGEKKAFQDHVMQIAIDNDRKSAAPVIDHAAWKDIAKDSGLGDLGAMLSTTHVDKSAKVPTSTGQELGASAGDSKSGGGLIKGIVSAAAVGGGAYALLGGKKTETDAEGKEPPKKMGFIRATVAAGLIAVGALAGVAAFRGGNMQGWKDAEGLKKVTATLASLTRTGNYRTA